MPETLTEGTAACVDDPGEDELVEEVVPVGEFPSPMPPQPQSSAAVLRQNIANDNLISSVFLMAIICRLHYRRPTSRNCRQ